MQNIALKIFIAENNTKKYILNLASDCLNELKGLITKTGFKSQYLYTSMWSFAGRHGETVLQ